MDAENLSILVKGAAIALLIIVMGASLAWARHSGGKARAAMGGALMLLFGGGMAPTRVLQTMVEEAKEEKGRTGAQSGDPPAPPN